MSGSQNGTSAQDESPVIFTTDEDGAEHRFQMIDMIEVDGQLYGLLLYLGEENEEKPEAAADEEGYDEEVVVMRIVEEDGEQVFEAIEDEAEFEKVLAFVEAMDEDDDGEEEEDPAELN